MSKIYVLDMNKIYQTLIFYFFSVYYSFHIKLLTGQNSEISYNKFIICAHLLTTMFYVLSFFALLVLNFFQIVLNFFQINLLSFYIGATISQNYDHNYRRL